MCAFSEATGIYVYSEYILHILELLHQGILLVFFFFFLSYAYASFCAYFSCSFTSAYDHDLTKWQKVIVTTGWNSVD